MRPILWTPAPPIAPNTRPLRQPGSLTARLAHSGKVTIDLRFSGWQAARPDEARALGLPHPGMLIYVREVRVLRNGAPAVLARSVTTRAGIDGPWRALRHLGRQPLATLLWSDPRVRRGAFEYTRLTAFGRLPTRRSCFWRQGLPLIVLEAFMDLPWPEVGRLPRRRSWLAQQAFVSRFRRTTSR